MNELENLFKAFITVVVVVSTLIGLMSGTLLLIGSVFMLLVEQNTQSAIVCFLSALGIGTILVYFWENIL